jgi:hypothetical protein
VEFADPDIAAVVRRQRNVIFNNHIIQVKGPTYTGRLSRLTGLTGLSSGGSAAAAIEAGVTAS